MPKNLNGQQSSGNTDWGTPDELMEVLRKEFGGFDLDPCCDPKNFKANEHFGPGTWRCGNSNETWWHGVVYVKGGESSHPCELCRPAEDGLVEDWFGAVFVNPPYGRQTKFWVEKCYHEVECGNAELVVALLPVSTGAGWWQTWVAKATEVRFLKGRVSFIRPGKPLGPATFDSAIVVWRRGQLGWGRHSYWAWKEKTMNEGKGS